MYKTTIQDKTFSLEISDTFVLVDGKKFDADIVEFSKGKFHILLEGRSYTAELLSIDKESKTCQVKVGRSVITVNVKDRYDELLNKIGIDAVAGKKVNNIKAPMPGMVLQVMVENGQQIQKGDAIVVLEAMKMENILKSPTDGIIRKIHVSIGDKVEKNQVMVNID